MSVRRLSDKQPQQPYSKNVVEIKNTSGQLMLLLCSATGHPLSASQVPPTFSGQLNILPDNIMTVEESRLDNQQLTQLRLTGSIIYSLKRIAPTAGGCGLYPCGYGPCGYGLRG